jgi:hypothetical protein
MPSHPLSAAKCLDALLRYELAAIRCYQTAESILRSPADRDALAAIRRTHEAAAGTLQNHVTTCGQTPSAEPGLWSVLLTLVETSALCSGRRGVLTMLLWAEQHGIQTYESARCIAGLPAVSRVLIETALLPYLHEHVRGLEQVIAQDSATLARARGPVTAAAAS